MDSSSLQEQPYYVPVNDVRGFMDYSKRLQQVVEHADWNAIAQLSQALRECWAQNRRVFLCGNGGSAGNAMHLANDLVYGVNPDNGVGMRAEALSSNPSVISCLANDIGYDYIFSHQIEVQASPGDVLLTLSGSGNSPNIINALAKARQLGLTTFSILGFSGGKCKALSDVAIHFPIDDMQIAEDMQLVVGHMVMQALRQQRC